MPFLSLFFGLGGNPLSPTKIGYRRKGTVRVRHEFTKWGGVEPILGFTSHGGVGIPHFLNESMVNNRKWVWSGRVLGWPPCSKIRNFSGLVDPIF